MSPALDFLAFIGPCIPLMILWKTFCGFIFAEILARRPLSASFSPCMRIYRMVSSTHAFMKSAAQKLVVLGPWRPCWGQIYPAYCWCSFGGCAPCWACQAENRFGCIWDDSAIWWLYSGLLFYRAQSRSTEIEEGLALAHIWDWTRCWVCLPFRRQPCRSAPSSAWQCLSG